MKDWSEINAWRRERRSQLVAARQGISAERRGEAATRIAARLLDSELLGKPRTLGFYWPFKAELDFRPLIHDLVQSGFESALPVVVEKNRPVEFWSWHPGMRMMRGIWNIPVPAKRVLVSPQVLLVPLLGFDEAGYRLGYGGGYYDRTLAGMDPKPLAIGVGLECGCLETIHPQPHDIPMDAIVTEMRLAEYRAGETGERNPGRATSPFGLSDDEDPNSRATYASPPCFMHEFE